MLLPSPFPREGNQMCRTLRVEKTPGKLEEAQTQADLCAVSPCRRLRIMDRNTDIPVWVSGVESPVTVWGGGGAPRAAAALLLATLRHVLGYSARLSAATANLCQLAQLVNLNNEPVVAPVAYLPSAGCGPDQQVDLVTTLAPAASAFSLHLLAHVTDEDCAEFVGNRYIYNTTLLEKCGFIEGDNNQTIKGNSEKFFAVLARNESEHDIRVSEELQQRIKSLELPLQIVYFQSDLLLRKEILKLQNESKAFLFLYEDIWSKVFKIFHPHPLPCPKPSVCCSNTLDPINAVRIGDARFMTRFAPPISVLVKRFAPESKDLRQILENEIYLNITIEQAACHWALSNENKVKNWAINEQNPPIYRINVYLCKDDPDYEEHVNVLNISIGLLQANFIKTEYEVQILKIDCLNTENFYWEISSLVREERIAGAIAWGWSVNTAVVDAAEANHLPLFLAGPTTPEVTLDSAVAVYSVTATLSDLSLAYLELFKRCGWTRMAIISDNTSYSKHFINLLLKKKELVHREKFIYTNNNTTNSRKLLEEYRALDARIFLINANWKMAQIILCTALELGMTPNAGFVWIVRDWRGSENCSQEDDWTKMYHFTLGLSWRGGQTAGGSKKLHTELQKLWRTHDNEISGSAFSASLSDALLLLGHGFDNFLHEYPSHMYDLHGDGNIFNFSKSIRKLRVNGSAHELNINTDEKLIFIEKWYGSRGSSIALWYVTQNGIRDLLPNETNTCKSLLGYQPPDRQRCIWATGDPFAPRCHVVTVSVVVPILILACVVLLVARRARLSSLRRLEKEESERVVSRLDGYLINRNSITLFHVIGSGSNGKVHFAELRKPSETVLVAAKEPHECITLFEMNDFLREACVLAPLYHENVIRLIGVCVGEGPPIVLTEHAYYNDLQRYLTFRRQFAISGRVGGVTVEEAMEVSDSELTRFAREAARALEYLANNKLVHRDVRAANCLVDKNRSLKLADFGLARELDSEATEYMTSRRGLFPVSWMPPESLIDGLFSPASDIWALGVLILEVATLGARPYGNWPLGQVLHYVKSGGHPPLPPDTSKQTRNLVLSCWQVDVNSRPSATFIHDFLTRNPQAISPALVPPDLPEPYWNFTKNVRTFDDSEKRKFPHKTTHFISMQL